MRAAARQSLVKLREIVDLQETLIAKAIAT